VDEKTKLSRIDNYCRSKKLWRLVRLGANLSDPEDVKEVIAGKRGEASLRRKQWFVRMTFLFDGWD